MTVELKKGTVISFPDGRRLTITAVGAEASRRWQADIDVRQQKLDRDFNSFMRASCFGIAGVAMLMAAFFASAPMGPVWFMVLFAAVFAAGGIFCGIKWDAVDRWLWGDESKVLDELVDAIDRANEAEEASAKARMEHYGF